MAIHTTKKRERGSMISSRSSSSCFPGLSSAPDDREEYERAAAFLREFHSRRVATGDTALHSASLDDILASDRIDDVLAREFSLALSVGAAASAEAVDRRSQRGAHRQRRATSSLWRMKKTTTSKCLIDLDVGHPPLTNDDESLGLFAGRGMRRTVSPVPVQEESALGLDGAADYFCFGYDDDDGPVTKRRRA